MKNSTTTNNTVNATAAVINPFDALTAAATNGSASRKLAYTDAVNGIAHERARDVVKAVGNDVELGQMANLMMASGDIADLIALFDATAVSEKVHGDAAALDGCDERTLKSMLESRRSDRSKCKKKGINNSAVNCMTYMADFYAELMIRDAMGKPYTGRIGANEIKVDPDDLDAVNRKIKSLQSKKSRVGKLAKAGDAAAQKELDEVVAEIERLQAYRPTTTTTVVKSIKVDELRKALASLSEDDLTDELRELMVKIG